MFTNDTRIWVAIQPRKDSVSLQDDLNLIEVDNGKVELQQTTIERDRPRSHFANAFVNECRNAANNA